MISAFGPDIWLIDGPSIKATAGFHYPTRMAVIKLSDGDLFVWSPVALTDELQQEVRSLGQVSYLIAPNSLHHVFLTDWIDAFPKAKVFAAPNLPEKRSDISFHATLSDTPASQWAGDIDQVVMSGNLITTEVIFFHRSSGTVLFTDVLQQLPPGWFSGWRALVAKLDLMSEREPSVPRKFRMAFRDKPALSRAVAKINAWKPHAAVMAHGTPVTVNVDEFLVRAFSWTGQ